MAVRPVRFLQHLRASWVTFSGLWASFAPSAAWHSRCTYLGMDRNDPKGIDERSLRFFDGVLTFVGTIRETAKTKGIIEQLVDSAGSIGANREEARGASTRKEFIRYNEIALRSANESVRWLQACASKRFGSQEQCIALLDEARQLARILGRIVVTSKRRDAGNSGADDLGPNSECRVLAPCYLVPGTLLPGTWYLAPLT